MTTQNKFLLAWENTIETVRDTLAEEFNNPDFKLDANSKDSKLALAVILENDLVDDVLTLREKETFIDAFHAFQDVSGKSSLNFVNKDDWHGHNYMRIVNKAKAVLRDELMLMKNHVPEVEHEGMTFALEA